METLAEAEEAEVARIDQEIAEIIQYLDPDADRTARQELARNVGIVSRGREFLREQQARLGELGRKRREHERRGRDFRSDVAAIDRTIGSYRAAIEALRRGAN